MITIESNVLEQLDLLINDNISSDNSILSAEVKKKH